MATLNTTRSATLCLVALTLAGSQPARAQWPLGRAVAETPHNLLRPARAPAHAGEGRLQDYGQVCVYCHASHTRQTVPQVALWNRAQPSGPYQMYAGDTDMTMDPQPAAGSLMCLSCHDGTMALDVIQNSPGRGRGPAPGQNDIGQCASCHRGLAQAPSRDSVGAWLGTDLSNTHPISITYDPLVDPGFRSAGEVEAGGLVLYDGKVECMTCHDPHSQESWPFLRVGNSNGGLCLTCHVGRPAGRAHDVRP
jgi:predicted CXXCH cytochrome family protein